MLRAQLKGGGGGDTGGRIPCILIIYPIILLIKFPIYILPYKKAF